MTVVYQDPAPFGNGPHTIAEIAQALRTKQYGKDVREAMAEGFENLDGQINSGQLVTEKQLKKEIDGIKDSQQKNNDSLNMKIDRITMGIDHDMLKKVVEEIMKDKGVI